MSSDLYHLTFIELAPRVRFELRIVHPDIDQFGTDKVFVWKLLSESISPPQEDDDDDDALMADKYIRTLDLSSVKDAKIVTTGVNAITVKRDSDTEAPLVIYTVELSDMSLVEGITKGDNGGTTLFVTAPAPKKKTAAKRKKKPIEVHPQTFDDVREAAFQGALLVPALGASLAPLIAHWSYDTEDDRVWQWLQRLPSFPDDPFSRGRPRQVARGAALVALAKLVSGKKESAVRFAALAEVELEKLGKLDLGNSEQLTTLVSL